MNSDESGLGGCRLVFLPDDPVAMRDVVAPRDFFLGSLLELIGDVGFGLIKVADEAAHREKRV